MEEMPTAASVEVTTTEVTPASAEVTTEDLLDIDADQDDLGSERIGSAGSVPSDPCRPQVASIFPSPVRRDAMHAHRKEDEVIRYPPAWQTLGHTGDVAASAAPGAQLPDEPFALGTVFDEGDSSSSAPAPVVRQFIARCEGRWRVRSAPSLNSKVIGSIASGTVVIGEDDLSSPTPRPPLFNDEASGTSAPQEPSTIHSLWVRVHRFEAKEPSGVSEIKRDIGSGGVMFCLRRNALGYGLYEVDVEPLDGPLIHLPHELSYELRGDAQRANAERNEDVSLTWKLLSAFDNVQRIFSGLSAQGDEAIGVNRDLRPAVKRRPEEAFEVKQREQLKRAAGVLRNAVAKLVLAGSSYDAEVDITQYLQAEMRGPFARLRASVNAAAEALPGMAESEQVQEVQEGGVSELDRFSQHCARIETSGPWPELGYELRQEVVSFSRKHAADLESCARRMQKMNRTASSDSPTAALKAISRSQGPGASSQRTPATPLPAVLNPGIDAPLVDVSAVKPPTPTVTPTSAAGASQGLPLLPPPPAPTCGLSDTNYLVSV